MSPSDRRLQSMRGVGIALACWLILAILHALGAFRIIDLKLLDVQHRVRGQQSAASSLALVEVDDATIAEYGQWPLPRETYAVLIAALEEAGVRTVGIDLLFLGEDEDPDSDRLLAGLTSQYDNIVHAMAFVPEDPAQGGGAATAPFQEALLMRHGLPFEGEWPSSAIRVSLPYDALLAAAPALGHISVAVDPDGVVRRVPQFVRYGDRVYPSLAFRVATAARGDSALPSLTVLPGRVRVQWDDGNELIVPVDDNGATAIEFVGDRTSFDQAYSMIEVIRWYRDDEMERLRDAFRDKVVLVGTTAVGQMATDIGPTPFSEATPLVFTHANAVNAVLQGRFLRQPAAPLVFGLLGLFVGALGWFFMTLPLPRAIALALAATILTGVVQFLLFRFGGFEMPGLSMLALVPAAYGVTEIYRRSLIDRHARERQREMEVARTIQRHLLPKEPPGVAEYDVHGFNIPAQEVGGDYYDWLVTRDELLAVCVGDVSGKGVAAALLMSHLRASFHAEARAPESPRKIVEAMHASLFQATDPGRFATFFLALFPRDAGTIRYCNAGHNPPLVVRGGAIEPIEATGLPLAMLEPELSPYEEGSVTLGSGDVIVIYSDGVTEAQLKDDLYGDERLRALVPVLVGKNLSAEQIANGILDDVREFTRGYLDADDVTVVVVKRF